MPDEQLKRLTKIYNGLEDLTRDAFQELTHHVKGLFRQAGADDPGAVLACVRQLRAEGVRYDGAQIVGVLYDLGYRSSDADHYPILGDYVTSEQYGRYIIGRLMLGGGKHGLGYSDTHVTREEEADYLRFLGLKFFEEEGGTPIIDGYNRVFEPMWNQFAEQHQRGYRALGYFPPCV